jgi:hypothetical protein
MQGLSTGRDGPGEERDIQESVTFRDHEADGIKPENKHQNRTNMKPNQRTAAK